MMKAIRRVRHPCPAVGSLAAGMPLFSTQASCTRRFTNSFSLPPHLVRISSPQLHSFPTAHALYSASRGRVIPATLRHPYAALRASSVVPPTRCFGPAAARRAYVTLNELKQGQRLHMLYTGPPLSTLRTSPPRSSSSRLLLVAFFAALGLVFLPMANNFESYLTGLSSEASERVMLWWLKYRETGTVFPHAGYTAIDGLQLEHILDTKVGRPYTMELLPPQVPEKLRALPEVLDGFVVVMLMGRTTIGSWNVPWIKLGVHACLRWTDTVKVVGTHGIAHLNISLRTFSNPEKRDLSSHVLGAHKGLLIERVELSFADGTIYVLPEKSFAVPKKPVH